MSRTVSSLVCGAVLGLFTLGGWACAATGTADDRLATVESLTGTVSNGQALYGSQCATCHGAAGGGGSGPSITGEDETELIEAMLSGPDEMPSYTGLTDQELADIAAFVVSM